MRHPWHARSSNVPTVKTNNEQTEFSMLSWSIIFLVVALIAAFLGFAGIAGTAAWIAKVLFVLFLVLFVLSLVSGHRRVLRMSHVRPNEGSKEQGTGGRGNCGVARYGVAGTRNPRLSGLNNQKQ